MITRGLSEMGRLALAPRRAPTDDGRAGRPGRSGPHLHRRSLAQPPGSGLALGRGAYLADVLARLGQVAEGVATAGIAAALAAKVSVPMPIIANVAAVLFGNKSPREAMTEILARDARAERD